MKRKKNQFIIILLGIVVGAGLYTSIQNAQQAQACGSAQGPIAGSPSVSAQTVQWDFQHHGSPPELQNMNLANHIINLSDKYQIDDAFALGLWYAEDREGTTGVATVTKNIGNMTYTQKYVDDNHLVAEVDYHKENGYIYAKWPTWQQGIDAWFQQAQGYVVDKGLTDFTTFSLYYAYGALTHNPTKDQQNQVASYVANIQTIVDETHQHQANLGTQAAGGSSLTSNVQLPPYAGWATPEAQRDAQKLGLFSCTDTHSMVGAAMNLAFHLTPTVYGTPPRRFSLFDRWDSNTPQPPAETLGGVVQCVSFVDSVYRMATGKSVPVAPNAGTWWQDYYLDGTEPGFKGIPVASGPPQPGDFIVYWDWDASTQSYQPPQIIGYDSKGNPIWKDYGHIAVIVGVQLPQGNQGGFIIVAQGNSTNVLAEQSLSANGSTWSVGQYDTGQQAQGYIRVISH